MGGGEELGGVTGPPSLYVSYTNTLTRATFTLVVPGWGEADWGLCERMLSPSSREAACLLCRGKWGKRCCVERERGSFAS